MSRKEKPTVESAAASGNEVEDLRRLVREQQQMIEALKGRLKQQAERIEQLEAEIKAYKKLKGKPKLSASQLNQEPKPEASREKRAGFAKRSKKADFAVDEERTIAPKEIPEGATFNGYRSYDVQDLKIGRHTIRFRLAEYVDREGKTVVGQLPAEYGTGHYGPTLISYVLYQHYQCRVPQPLIYEQLREWGVDLSVGQVNRILTEQHQERFAREQQQVLRVGLETAGYIHTDDTGARHQGENGYCTVIGNEWFASFHTSETKSRQNFLELLQAGTPQYVLNRHAYRYLRSYHLAKHEREKLRCSKQVLATNRSDWQAYLATLGIVRAKAIQWISEAALLGGAIAQGLSDTLRILSDAAGQFNLLWHGLCWVHAERGLRKLQGDTDAHRRNIAEVQALLWSYYRSLHAYRQQPSQAQKVRLAEEFDAVFGRCYFNHAELNRVLEQLRRHKAELLRVLEYPRLPLHNNAAETDIREYVTRRKISGGTRSDAGRDARDIFVGLKKTCRKLGVSFWQFLCSRLRGDSAVEFLPDLIRAKATATV